MQWRCNAIASWMDSRFKIPTDSFQQILNPGFKIQDSQRLFWANLESKSWIQDSRFLGTLSSKSWIQDSRFKIPRDSLQEILNPGFKMDSRFAPKSSWESWILNPGVAKMQAICSMVSIQRVPGNLESWILLDSSWIFDIPPFPSTCPLSTSIGFTSTGSSCFDSHPCLPCQLCNTHWVAFGKRKSVELSWFVWYPTLPFHLSIVNGLHFAFTSTGSSWFAAFPASCAIPTGMHLVSASLLSWAGLFDIPPFPSTCPLSMDCTLRSHLLDQVGSIHIPSFPASCAIPTGLHFVSASLLSWAGLFDIPPFPSTCPLSMDWTLRSHLLGQVSSYPSWVICNVVDSVRYTLEEYMSWEAKWVKMVGLGGGAYIYIWYIYIYIYDTYIYMHSIQDDTGRR